MRRTRGLRLPRLIIVLILGTASVAVPGASSAARRERPNVLVILTDDQALGTMSVMPQTRQWLVRGGTTFSSAYATTPQCCPSRATIMTGLYAHNHQVRTNDDAANLDTDRTVQHELRDAGYRTAFFGKYLNSWPVSVAPPDFDTWATFARSRAGYTGGSWNVDGDTREIDQYGTGFLADRATRFVWDQAGTRRPWLMFVSTAAPHSPAHPQARYRDAAIPAWVPDPAVFENNKRVDPTRLSDKPPFMHRPVPAARDAAEVRAAQLRALYSVDDLVGRLHTALMATKQESDTLVLFLSDNGFMWGQHGRLWKAVPYAPAVRIPMFVRWGGPLAASATDDRLVATIDVAPTILQAAGLAGEGLDGRSLLGSHDRDYLLLEYWQQRDNPQIPSWASIVTAQHQYVEYYDDTSSPTFTELYDLETDPYQLTNILADVVAQQVPSAGDRLGGIDVSSLARTLTAARSCGGMSCP